MAQLQVFAVRLDTRDRQILERLAQREQSTVSNVVRALIRQADKPTERPAQKAEALSINRS